MTTTFTGWERPKTNYTKIPHSLFDVMSDLSGAELKVILYVLRHTWGFSEYDKPKKITTDEFMNGRKKKDGSRIDTGTGLSNVTVLKALKDAVEHGFLEVTENRTDMARIKKYYSLKMKADELPEPQYDAFEENETGDSDDFYEPETEEITLATDKKVNISDKKLNIGDKKTTYRTEKETPEINHSNSAQAEQPEIKQKPKTVINRKDLSLEGQIYMSNEPVIMPTEQDERNRRMRDFAAFVGFQNSSAGALAMAFMEARGLVFDIKADGKREKKFATELLLKGVKPEHIKTAVLKMTIDRIAEGKEPLTCVSLGSVSKIAIDLATQLPEAEVDNTPVNGWGEFED